MIRVMKNCLSKKLNRDNIDCDNNKGFTLIEIIVALAIFSIVVIVVMSFFISMTKANRTVGDSTSLQYEARRVSSFIIEKAMESKSLKGGSMTLASGVEFYFENNDGTDKYDYFILKDTNIYYNKQNTTSAFTPLDANKLGSYIKEMSVTVADDVLTIKMNMEKGTETFEYSQNVKLRNAE